jgi:hypothetical protein
MKSKTRGDKLEEVYFREAGVEITVNHDARIRDRLNKEQEKVLRALEGEAKSLEDLPETLHPGESFELTIEEIVGEKQYELMGRIVSKEFNRKIMHDCEFYPCRGGTPSADLCCTKNYVRCKQYGKLRRAEAQRGKDL